jgi:hypothetical protein
MVEELQWLLGALPLIAVACLLILAWIDLTHRVLRPLTSRGGPRGPTASYTMVDVVCLLLWLSLLGAGVSRVAAAPWVGEAWLVLAVLVIESVGSWWLGVRLVSAAGVVDWRRRVVCQLVIVPLALFGPPLAMALPFVLLYYYEPALVCAIWPAAPAALLAAYLLARWVARGATAIAASSPPIELKATLPR